MFGFLVEGAACADDIAEMAARPRTDILIKVRLLMLLLIAYAILLPNGLRASAAAQTGRFRTSFACPHPSRRQPTYRPRVLEGACQALLSARQFRRAGLARGDVFSRASERLPVRLAVLW